MLNSLDIVTRFLITFITYTSTYKLLFFIFYHKKTIIKKYINNFLNALYIYVESDGFLVSFLQITVTYIPSLYIVSLTTIFFKFICLYQYYLLWLYRCINYYNFYYYYMMYRDEFLCGRITILV